MTGLDLRPLSLGEILDRTFSLYRRHFLLFLGISAIPQTLVLAASLAMVTLQQPDNASDAHPVAGSIVVLLFLLVTPVASLFFRSGTILAGSAIFPGRPAPVADSPPSPLDQIPFSV